MPGVHIFGLMIRIFDLGMKRTLKELSTFIGVWLIYAISLICLLLSKGYYDSFLFLNAIRFSWADILMPHVTHLGEGVFLAMLFSFWILNKDRPLVNSLLVALISVGLLLFCLKQFVFFAWHRPPKVYENLQEIYFISLGKEKYKSFPSGHSTAIWMLMSLIAFYAGRRRKPIQIACAILAGLVAFSRVYIGVHFPGDILVGSFLGIFLSTLVLSFHYPVMQKRAEEDRLNKAWKNHLLIAFLIFLFVSSLIRMYFEYYA
ncbi:MAG: phosphatase PAP2 family protein [Bacteroidota bacterium]